MTFRSAIKITEKYIIDNSPTLLSGLAVTGTLMVAYLTGKATFKAVEIIDGEEAMLLGGELTEKMVPLSTKDRAKLVWKCYIPPAAAVGVTVGMIVVANHISASRMAALAAAYKLSEKQIGEYKDKVVEKLGFKEEQKIRDELNQEAVDRTPVLDNQVMIDDSNVLCFEKWTGRYFRSNMESLRSAENKINHSMITDMYATLSDFYDWIGLTHTQESGEVGWSMDNLMELAFTSGMAHDGRTPILIMEYRKSPVPIRDYHHAGHGAFH